MFKLVRLGAALGLSSLALLAAIEPMTAQTTVTGNKLTVSSSSYLGSTGTDQGMAAEIGLNGAVVLGGTLPGNNFGKLPTNLKAGSATVAGGNGVILLLSPGGAAVQSVTRLGNIIDDLDILPGKQIAAVGDFGLALLSADAKTVAWSKSLGTGGGAFASSGRRVAVGRSLGDIAALFNKKVTVFNASGVQLGQFLPGGTTVEDVAIDDVNKTVFVTGYTQKDGGGCSQLQVAYIRAFSYTGTLKWKGYDWTHAQAYGQQSSCADTRGVRIAIGKDNMLYFAGESAGGNSIFRFRTNALTQTAPNVKFDAFNDPYNTKSNHITYYARLSPTTGQMVAGQFALARLSTGGGNTIRPRAITADAKGNVYVGGVSAASIANRRIPDIYISGEKIGIYVGGDNFLLVVSPDFKTRKAWVTWTATGSTTNTGSIVGIGVGSTTAAVTGTTPGKVITVSPIQPTLAGGSDAFVSVFPLLP